MAKRKKSAPRKPSVAERARRHAENVIRSRLEGLSKGELVERIMRIARSDRDLWRELEEEFQAETAVTSPTDLIELAHVAIAEATEVGLEYGGDYEKVKRLLKQLLNVGQADAVLELGRELYQYGQTQVELTDERLMCDSIDDCLSLVFDALPKSSLTGIEQMLWVWELAGKDEHVIAKKASQRFWKRKFSKADWSQFADVLLERLAAFDAAGASKPKRRQHVVSKAAEFTRQYHRGKLVRKAQEALKKAGRAREAAGL
jgi:uncharacterized Zn finger protein